MEWTAKIKLLDAARGCLSRSVPVEESLRIMATAADELDEEQWPDGLEGVLSILDDLEVWPSSVNQHLWMEEERVIGEGEKQKYLSEITGELTVDCERIAQVLTAQGDLSTGGKSGTDLSGEDVARALYAVSIGQIGGAQGRQWALEWIEWRGVTIDDNNSLDAVSHALVDLASLESEEDEFAVRRIARRSLRELEYRGGSAPR